MYNFLLIFIIVINFLHSINFIMLTCLAYFVKYNFCIHLLILNNNPQYICIYAYFLVNFIVLSQCFQWRHLHNSYATQMNYRRKPRKVNSDDSKDMLMLFWHKF